LGKTSIKYPNIQEEAFPNNFDQRHVLNVSQTLKIKNLELALGWNYASGRPFTKLISTDSDDEFIARIDPRGLNSSRFPSYHRLDISALYRINTKSSKIIMGASLRNVYSRNNTISQGYNIGIDANDLLALKTFKNASLRLTPDFVLRVNF